MAYAAQVGDKWLVVVDGEEGKYYEDVLNPVFSQDCERVAYAAHNDDNYFVVEDGIEGEKYAAVASDSIRFSPDSSRLAYVAGDGEKLFVVINFRSL